MNIHLRTENDVAGISADGGPVTRATVRRRAIEIAAACGRSVWNVTKTDWKQAVQELMPQQTHALYKQPGTRRALERWENEGGEITGMDG